MALAYLKNKKAPLDSGLLFTENPCPFVQSAGTRSGESGLHQSSSTIIRIVVVRIISGLSSFVCSVAIAIYALAQPADNSDDDDSNNGGGALMQPAFSASGAS